MKIVRIPKWLVIVTLLAYGALCAWGGAFMDRLEPMEAVTAMAYSNDIKPLEQTPVVRKIDLTPTETTQELSIQVLKQNAQPLGRILIYHTHTFEAYKKTEQTPYKETEKWRTRDEAYNVVRVGKELAALLKSKGYDVVHDTNAYEPPNLSTSYARSLVMLENRTKNGEAFDLYIDLHRDAYSSSMANNNTVMVGDQSLARLMVLVGKGSGQTYTVKPDWEKNYQIAQTITDSINEQVPNLCRKISLKSGRFNQHIAPKCILIEAGNNENTLEEVLASMPYLADSIHGAVQNIKYAE